MFVMYVIIDMKVYRLFVKCVVCLLKGFLELIVGCIVVLFCFLILFWIVMFFVVLLLLEYCIVMLFCFIIVCC